MIVWTEQDPADPEGVKSIERRCTNAEAIAAMKEIVAKTNAHTGLNFRYANDQDALEDFMTVHWAWTEPD